MNEKHKILIVDDDEKMRKVAAESLKNYDNFSIIEAENGLDGINKVLKNDVSAIITDLDMPEMTGLEFLGFLKSHNKHKRIPVVFLTSFSDEYHKNKAMALGAHSYLNKPLKATELNKTINGIFKFDEK